VTEQKLAELATHESERRFREILERVQLIAVMIDRTGLITFCNDHLLRLTGWTRAELLGRNWYDVFPHPSEAHRRDRYLAAVESGEMPKSDEITILTRDGDELIITCNDMLLRDSSGRVIGMTSISEDITERRRAEERVEYLAHYDELTGLPNRDLFARWLDLAIERCHAHNRHAAVLFISLDNFTLINDSLGHTAGDELLRQFAAACETPPSVPSWSPATAASSSWCWSPTRASTTATARTSCPRTSPRWRRRWSAGSSTCWPSPSATTAARCT